MANKRQRKKNEKRLLRQKVKADKHNRLSEKQIEKLSYSDIKSVSQRYEKINRQEKSEKRKRQRQNTRRKKIDYIESLGLNKFDFTIKQIDSIKIKDIEKHNVNAETYPWLYENIFDFNKVYHFPDGIRCYVAFRDFTGEVGLSEILNEFDRYDEQTLLEFLRTIVNMPIQPKNSNGKAGDYRFIVADQKTISMFHNGTYNTNRRKRTKQHSGAYKGFQVLKDGRYNSFSEFTPRKILVLANALMHNITQFDRVNFYNRFYADICYYFPDFKDILPSPQ